MDRPSETLAAQIAQAVSGVHPIGVRRFTTGAHHYVYEAAFTDAAPLVIRIADAAIRSVMADAAKLSQVLRPLGAPLPAILAEGLDVEPFAYLVLERLPGRDLGDVIAHLPEAALRDIAGRVATAQELAARLARADRFGYAVDARDAPYPSWRDVLEANLARSRSRIAAAGLFDAAPVHAVSARIAAQREAIGRIEPTPFLHDTTMKNVIVTETGAFSGIVDVDDLGFGDPRYVAALTLASLLTSRGPQIYVEAWMQAAGWRDDALFRLYVALFLVDFMGEHGQDFNGNRVASTPETRAHLTATFAHALREADADAARTR